MVSDLYLQFYEDIAEAVDKGEQRLDVASEDWRERVDEDMLIMNDVEWCLLTQLFGGYKEGLDFLGIDLGEEYGFDIPDTIYDPEAQEEAYFMLVNEWISRLG